MQRPFSAAKAFPQRVAHYLKTRWHQKVRMSAEESRHLLELLALLEPQQARGQRKLRVGASRDGGYVMLDDFAPVNLALSLGIGPDVSWDYAVAERGIPVRQYDHTVAGPPQAHPRFHFTAKRISARPASDEEIALGPLLEGHAEASVVLKMDIDGDEWAVLAGLTPHQLRSCRQIVLELHGFIHSRDPAWRATARQVLELLTGLFAVVHVHGNNLSQHLLAQGHELPDNLEVTLASRACYTLEPTTETFPGPCDKKNNPYFPDFRLGRFKF